MRIIEERIMAIGAQTIEELLLHREMIEVTLRKGISNHFGVNVDGQLVAIFREDEMEELEYKARRINLSKEGKKQLDKIWQLKQETKKQLKENETIDRVISKEITIEDASTILNKSKQQVSKLVKERELIGIKGDEEKENIKEIINTLIAGLSMSELKTY